MPRLIDTKIEKYLKFFGAVCVVGPRRGGTTRISPYHCNNAIYIGNPAGNFQNLQLATLSPELVPDGDIPRLVDEWPEVPQIWDAVRYRVDQTPNKGQFILTSSVTPNHKGIYSRSQGQAARCPVRSLWHGKYRLAQT